MKIKASVKLKFERLRLPRLSVDSLAMTEKRTFCHCEECLFGGRRSNLSFSKVLIKAPNFVFILIILFVSQFSFAADSNSLSSMLPSINDIANVIDKSTQNQNLDEQGGKDWSTPVKLVIIFSGLAILPSLLVMMTSFTRIVIVLSFVRKALGTQSIPPTIAIMGLALFLTLYTMAPTFSKINQTSIQPYLAEQMDFGTAAQKAGDGIKEFMLRQCRESDLALFVQMSKMTPPKDPMQIGLHVVIPAFIISEFRISFEIGCLLFIPFLVIDLVISSVLLSAGMMMLPPVMISMPFKLILFILVDGWGLLAKSLGLGFN